MMACTWLRPARLSHPAGCRDLKLDNTLLDGARPPCIKICDFGFAKGWTADSNMYTHIGCVTPLAAALAQLVTAELSWAGKVRGLPCC